MQKALDFVRDEDVFVVTKLDCLARQVDLVRDFEAPGCSETLIAEHYGISRSSVYRLYAENRSQSV
ncbi:MAG: hypothetical protein AB7F20_05665 [Geoalkalibacter sp.]|uniref:hypothetical protein n=1 Tax=Geoalkalibacter sp. TaxID=3041440 RepID=UPI003D14E8BF